jgi:hypothetical protein
MSRVKMLALVVNGAIAPPLEGANPNSKIILAIKPNRSRRGIARLTQTDLAVAQLKAVTNNDLIDAIAQIPDIVLRVAAIPRLIQPTIPTAIAQIRHKLDPGAFPQTERNLVGWDQTSQKVSSDGIVRSVQTGEIFRVNENIVDAMTAIKKNTVRQERTKRVPLSRNQIVEVEPILAIAAREISKNNLRGENLSAATGAEIVMTLNL